MPKFTTDAIDQKILDKLQENGRITNHELADTIGLSPSPCLRWVRQLEAARIISGYVALVDPDTVGLTLPAFVRVRLDQQDDGECYLMSGDDDYQMRVLVGSLREFEDFLRHRLTHVKGVASVTTSFALRPVIYKTALPNSEMAIRDGSSLEGRTPIPGSRS